MNSFELFAGAGGLAMGITQAGFRHVGVLEKDPYACDTIRYNQAIKNPCVKDWPLIQADSRDYDFRSFQDKVALVSGGPPCQPFSIGGKHQGRNDGRDMFPEAVRAIRETRPEAFIFENVRGLARPSFYNYFAYILLQLELPEAKRRNGEDWDTHHKRLERIKTESRHAALRYNIVHRILNAADYGVPQKRERVFIVGFRQDLGMKWSFPEPTHGEAALYRSQWVTGEYWDRHRISKRKREEIRGLRRKKFNIFNKSLCSRSPWRTVRDAIHDLPDPGKDTTELIHNHIRQPGARSYPGHTGSPIDYPAKTLKAGDHGVPGGENMLRDTNESVRYFTVRESARLQTFPDDFVFHGSWTETMRQLGNAVPVALSQMVALSVRKGLEKFKA